MSLLLRICSLLFILLARIGLSQSQDINAGASSAAEAARSAKSVKEFLTAGGHFDPAALRTTKYQGGLDLTGYDVVVDPINGEPTLKPISQGSAQSEPDDIYWDSDLSSSLPGTDSTIHAMTVYDQKLIVGGEFSIAGNIFAIYIASWDGANWSTFGSGMNGTVRALTVYNGIDSRRRLHNGWRRSRQGNCSLGG